LALVFFCASANGSDAIRPSTDGLSPDDLAKLAEERDQEVAQQIEQRLREIDSTASGRVVELSVETFERLAGKRHLLVLFYTNW
jgi:hypothetical protein